MSKVIKTIDLGNGMLETPCPNLYCNNTIIYAEDPNPVITLCGGKIKLCDECCVKGYRAHNGRGDGMMCILHEDEDKCHEYRPIYGCPSPSSSDDDDEGIVPTIPAPED